METSIKNVAMQVVITPMITAFGHRGYALRRLLAERIPNDLLKLADTGSELLALIDQELRDFDLGIPLKSIFIDGENGVQIEADHVAYVDHPLLCIVINDGLDKIAPTIQ